MARKFISGFHWLTFLTISLLLVASCTNRDDIEQPAPQVVNSGVNGGKDTINAGDQLVLHPVLNVNTYTSFQWAVNGKASGADSVYTFQTDSSGDYTITYKAISPWGTATIDYLIHVWGKYENGFFIINEGWFGHDNGSLNFYHYGADTITQMVYQKENAGKQLGTTTDFGAVYNGKLYIVSKSGPLVIADAVSLKETGRIESLPAEGHAFLGLDNTKGLISTADGIYPIDLQSLTVGSRVAGIDGNVGSLIKQGDYVFALTQDKGTVVLKQSDYSVVKTIAGMTEGFAKTTDNMIWMAGGTSVVKIDPASLDTASVVLPFTAGNTWFAWTAGTLTASSTENAVFLVKSGEWTGGSEVYKYIPGNSSSLDAPFITLPTGKEFYGAAIRYDASANTIVGLGIQSGWGDNSQYNSLYFYNAASGSLEKTVSYTYYYFPAQVVFH